jgi:hypothetical protein
MDNLQIDFMNANGQFQGDLAVYMQTEGKINIGAMRPFVNTNKKSRLYGRPCISLFKGGDPSKLSSYQTIPIQTNATLRRDEWKQLDEAVLAISETRLNGVQDLISNNLVFNLGNAMGTTVLEWHDVSDAMEADLTMDGIPRSQGDRPVFTTKYLPIPIIHVDYQINSRVLEASRKLGNPLDTTSAERGARKVSERLENMLFTNTSYPFGGGTIYSYINEPNRNIVSLPLAWDDGTKTGALILTDVLNIKQAAIDALHYGPYALYIPTAYETVLDGDYDTTTPGTTIRERILKIENINSVKVIDTLPANNIVLVQMTSDVVRLVRGMGIQNVEWETEGKFITKYKVMTIQVPQIRSDQDGNSGLVHMS